MGWAARLNPTCQVPRHPFEHLRAQPETRKCCRAINTLRVRREDEGLWSGTCLVCGAIHYRMRAEGGKLFQGFAP